MSALERDAYHKAKKGDTDALLNYRKGYEYEGWDYDEIYSLDEMRELTKRNNVPIIQDSLSNRVIDLDMACAVKKDPENSSHLIVKFDPEANSVWYEHLYEEFLYRFREAERPIGTYRIYDFSMDRYKNALKMGYQWFEQNIEKI